MGGPLKPSCMIAGQCVFMLPVNICYSCKVFMANKHSCFRSYTSETRERSPDCICSQCPNCKCYYYYAQFIDEIEGGPCSCGYAEIDEATV